jgi:hypothetical protein
MKAAVIAFSVVKIEQLLTVLHFGGGFAVEV